MEAENGPLVSLRSSPIAALMLSSPTYLVLFQIGFFSHSQFRYFTILAIVAGGRLALPSIR